MASDAEALRIFAVGHPHVARTLKDKLELERIETILALRSAQDWPDFKQRVGKLTGLETAIDLCKELEDRGDA